MKTTNSQTARGRKSRPPTPTPTVAGAAVPEESIEMNTQPIDATDDRPAIERRVRSAAVLQFEKSLGVALPPGSPLAGLIDTLLESDRPAPHRDFRLDEGGAVGLELVRIARRPEIFASLEDLECQSWRCATIDLLERTAEAAIELYTLSRHARRHLVSPAVLAEAEARRDRLMALLMYHFAKDEEMMEKAARIDPGKTQTGLASALIDLHALLAPHQGFLSHDRTSYDATDFEEAPKLAQRIMRGQAATVTAEVTAVRRALRAELVQSFDDVSLAVGFVTRHWSKVPVLPTLGELTRERRQRQGGLSPEEKAKRAAKQAAKAAEAEAKKAAAETKKAAKAAKAGDVAEAKKAAGTGGAAAGGASHAKAGAGTTTAEAAKTSRTPALSSNEDVEIDATPPVASGGAADAPEPAVAVHG